MKLFGQRISAGVAALRLSLGLAACLLHLALAGVAHAAPPVIFVDKDAAAGGDGSSWALAYQTLQAALDVTNANGSAFYQVWVAEGTYYPDEGGSHANNSRDESFRINYDNVQLYGGFVGDETARGQRDWAANLTVLSGDIDEDGTLTGNAYHVLYLDGASNENITAATVLDGFTITGGNADGSAAPYDGGGVYCDGSGAGHLCSPLLANLQISGNSAVLHGGGMFNNGDSGASSPTLTNVTLSGNSAEYGGGMFNNGYGGASSPVLTDLTLSGNSAGSNGGGVFNNGFFGESSPVLLNVTLSGNSAGSSGGGVFNYGYGGASSPVLTNVTLSGNSAKYGGGVSNDGYGGASSPVLTDVTLSGNRAGTDGGGMYNGGYGGASSPVLTNVTLSGNSAGTDGGGMYNNGMGGASSPVLTNVTLSGNSAGTDGGGMYNDGDYGVSSPVLLNSILWGNTAGGISNQIYDNGDGATPSVTYSSVQGGGYAGDGNIEDDPLFVAPVAASNAPTATGNYRLLRTSPAIDAGTNTGCPPDDLDNGVRPRDGHGDGTATCDMGAYESSLIFVDTGAPGPAHDGLSWTTAYANVQEALDETNGNGLARYEVWVAEGTYHPDEGGSHTPDSRSESFRIAWDNVQIYGGFAATETARTQRDWTAHPAILSGDIDGGATLAGNANHVLWLDGVTHEGLTAAAVVDGFTITGGNADDSAAPYDGGGVYCDGSGAGHLCSPLLANLQISGNSAVLHGGGMYSNGSGNGESSPTLENVLLSDNSAEHGGGLYNEGGFGKSSPALTNVTIHGNTAASDGGGLFNNGHFGESRSVLAQVIISGNSAGNRGGGVYNDGRSGVSSAVLTNVLLSGNSAADGGGMFTNGDDGGVSSPLLTNVTISSNSASQNGGGLYIYGAAGTSNPQLLNSILWGNTAAERAQFYTAGGWPAVTYSNVQDAFLGGLGNLSDDPLFAAPITGTLAPTTTGDYRLLPGSPSIDSGTETGAPDMDLRGLPRPVGPATDMGAYEAQGFTLAVTGGDGQSAAVGAAFSQPLAVQIESLGSEPVGPGGVITFTPPSSGAGITVTQSFTVATDANGTRSALVRANGVVGSYAVTATMRGAAGPALFNLTNTPISVTVVLSGTGGGTVTSTPAGIDCGVTCTVAFDYSTTVTLAAAAGAGSTFDGWSGACSGTGCSLVITETKAVTAAFTLNQYTIVASANPPAGGSASGGGTVNHGDTVTATATANTGYTFANWTEGGMPVSSSATYTFTAVGSRTLVANFTLNQYTVGVSANPPAGGSASGGGTVNHGDTVTATATANTGYTFANWTEGGTPVSSSATYTFTAESSRTLVANFTLNQYTVGVSANPPAGGSASGGGTVNHGDTVTATATANTGYTFANWTESGTPVSSSATYTFTAESSRTLVANFRPNSPLHVDADAPGPMHDGLSWTTAFTNVQDALYWANRYGTTGYEIWVAEGVYYPDEGAGHVADNRSESFRIAWNNVQLYGGFAATETLRTQRDWAAHPAVLSGDIDGDGTATGSAYHVIFLDGVTNEGITDATVLDGFTVTGGNGDGDGAPPNDRGGGLYCDGSNGHLCSPALTNLIFGGNGAYYGGAMYNDGSYGVSSPVLWNVTFSDNLAFLGGGVFNSGYYGVSSPSLTLVTISNNAASDGGGIYNDGVFGASSPVLANVTISGNYVDNAGGGMFNDGIYGVSSPVLTNVTLSGNQAGYGGAMYNKGAGGVSSPVLVNAIISGNRAGFDGGGMVNNGFLRGVSSPVLTNVTLSGNSAAESGGGMYSFGRYFGTVNPVLTNSIVWGNEAITSTQFYDYEATPQVTYSNVQGDSVYTGTGNINAEPLFVTPVAAGSAPVTAGDYRLLPGSPSIDSGTDTGAPPTDIRGLPRPVGRAADMGAYEAQGFRLAISGGNNQSAAVGAAFSQPLAVQIASLGGEPVGPGGVITVMPPASGPGLSVTTPFTLATDAEGAAGTGAMANQYAGSYNVTIAAGGVITPVAFTLTNTPAFLTAEIAGTGSGAVTSDPAGIQCPSTCTAGFDLGTVVTLTASAETGSTFGGWSGACSGAGACTVTMTETKAVAAVFTLNQYTVAVSAEPAASGTVSGGGTVSHGDTVTVTASASTGYTFINWTEGGAQVSTSATYTFAATGSRILVANFTLLPQPLARNDAASLLEGQEITIPVLANDLDPAGRGLAVIAVTQPGHGAASIDGSQASVRYTATGGFHSEDSFDYTLEDRYGLTSTAKVVVVMAPLAHAEQAPQLAVIDPSVPNSTTFASNMASVQVQLPAGFYSSTVGTAGIFFLSYTAVVTPTQQTLAPPPTLKFGNFQFFLSAYANDLPLHGVSFALPITLTIRYDPALLLDMDPERLQLQSWDGSGWGQDGITFVSHDIPNATLTVRLSHLSEFALFAASKPTGLDPAPEPDGALEHLYLPVVNNQALAAAAAEPALPAGVSRLYLPAVNR